MALKSARLAGLDVPVRRRSSGRAVPGQRAARRRGRVRIPEPDKLPPPTAVGLLSRMYQGWPRDHPRLNAACATWKSSVRPGPTCTSITTPRRSCTTTRPGWDAWNRPCATGWWPPIAPRPRGWQLVLQRRPGKSGGRLYTTAMCVMILEVYYRYMPLYGTAGR